MDTLKHIALPLIAIAALSAPAVSQAMTFADNSKLAQGRWVKIAVTDNGVYQLTPDELLQMGFSDPKAVKIFGHGGHIMPDYLSELAKDDLQQIPTIVADNGKLCFYANGVHTVVPVSNGVNTRFDVVTNAYSNHGYYFLTDDSSYATMSPQTVGYAASDADAITSSYAYYFHEQELVSPSTTGKNLLGENITTAMQFTDEAYLPDVIEGSRVMLSTTVGGRLTSNGTVSCSLNGVTTTFASGSRNIPLTANNFFYDIANTHTYATATQYADRVPLRISVSSSGIVHSLYVDRYIVSYQRQNLLRTSMSQVRLDLAAPTAGSTVQVLGVNSGCMALGIDDTQAPVLHALQCDDMLGQGAFSIAADSEWSSFVVFDPTRELLSIDGYETVENQNLHGMDTPDYVILSAVELLPQAERIAQLHRSHDGMDVAIVTQQPIFNEFSSGAPDPTAVRLFMKMLYDKDRSKLKYLLLLGDATYDNRRLVEQPDEEKLITYQTDISRSDTESFNTDDFFGFLADDSDTDLSELTLSISVGRIPSSIPSEVDTYIDKLEEYICSPDLGEWRNNAIVVGGAGDDGMHEGQASGIASLLNGGVSSEFNVWRIYDEAFSSEKECRGAVASLLKRGQIFYTFVGHSTNLNLSSWTISEVESTNYNYWPFATFATCDIARIDSESRGLAEKMLFKRDGGMIAGLAATRTAFASYNDLLNTRVVRYLFSLDGSNRRTIGEACRLAKNNLVSNDYLGNKLKYHLLGDPAMVVNWPLPWAAITTVNGVDVSGSSTVTVYPMQEVTISGLVRNSNSNGTNTSFAGTAVVTIYDAETMYSDLASTSTPYKAMRSREVLAQATTQVQAGHFTTKLVLPQFCTAQGDNGMIRVYAYNEDGSILVNGATSNVVIAPYDETRAITDGTAPEIEAMYIDNEDFSDGDRTNSNITFYARFADDKSLNIASTSLSGSVTLTLDGGTTYSDVKGALVMGEGGKTATLAYPIDGLSTGLHTLTLSVCDAAGNSVQRAISFYVDDNDYTAIVQPSKRTATSEAVIDLILPETVAQAPDEVALYVVDSKGKTVWNGQVSSFPYTWNLTDNDGNRVAPGLYRISGYDTHGSVSITTNQGEIIVLNL